MGVSLTCRVNHEFLSLLFLLSLPPQFSLNTGGRGLSKFASNLLFYSKDVLDLDWTTTDVFRFNSVRPLKVSQISTGLKQIFIADIFFYQFFGLHIDKYTK